MKIAKFDKSKWANVFSLVYVITKLGGKIILVKVNFLMGGNALEIFKSISTNQKLHFDQNDFFPQFCYDINQRKNTSPFGFVIFFAILNPT